ncbi:MAG: TfoX/Sxy family protein [Reinekea sp.]|jgi:TfoX/Sxy family transcriptional regulator of competence genes|nr:TfoX/Sxy family protein [Reinekea sp.]MDX1473052.1 TfoX/Sxy family protein [Reinekea sp.]
MAYDEGLAERIRNALPDIDGLAEKKMFGGLAFMVRGNMCVGIVKDQLMARVGPEQYPQALQQPGAREMDFTGRVMKGMVFVDAQHISEDDQLQYWCDLCLGFVAGLPGK